MKESAETPTKTGEKSKRKQLDLNEAWPFKNLHPSDFNLAVELLRK